MTTAIKRRRGTTSEHSTFTGLEGEITIDSTKDTVVVHDGATTGGFPLAKEVNGVLTTPDINGGTIDGTAIGANAESTGAFTTLAASGAVTLSGGTANGVAYLNGSKVLTSGSALTFDGAKLESSGDGSAGQLWLNSNVSGLAARVLLGESVAKARYTMGWLSDTSTAYLGTEGNFPLYFQINGSEQMRLTSTGLGIGTSSISNKLEVAGTDGSTTALVKDAASGNQQLRLATDSVLVARSSGSNGGLTLGTISQTWGASGGFVKINTNGSTVATFDQSGNLGLGVTPSGWASDRKAMQVNLSSVSGGNGNNFTVLGNNIFNDGAVKYIITAAASQYVQNTSGAHLWLTAPSGTAGNAISFTQAMTLTAGGNLLVGATSDISGNGAYGTFGNSSAGGANRWAAYFGTNSSSSNPAPNFGLTIGWNKSGGGGESNIVYGTGLGSSPALAFSTSDGTTVTERARIDSSGNLLVGRTVASRGGVDVYYANTDGINSASGLSAGSSRSLYTGWHSATSTTSGSLSFNVTTNGNVTNTNNSYGAISDIKLKENITDATPKLEKLKQVRVVNYNFKEGQTHKQIGVIAQELEQVFPSMVEEAPDRDADGNDLGTTTKSVKYSVFVPMLIKAIQEQQAIIESLKARLDAANL